MQQIIESTKLRPMDVKIIVTRNADKSKNHLEIVHATPTLTSDGYASLPSATLPHASTEIQGVPPVTLDAVRWDRSKPFLANRSLRTVQCILFMTNEDPTLEQDNTLVRMQRKVTCAITKIKIIMLVTAPIHTMPKLLRLTENDSIYATVRLVSHAEDSTTVRVISWRTFAEREEAYFIPYFREYLHGSSVEYENEALQFGKDVTPGKRRKMIQSSTPDSAGIQRKLFPTPPQ